MADRATALQQWCQARSQARIHSGIPGQGAESEVDFALAKARVFEQADAPVQKLCLTRLVLAFEIR
jgi:hypothetical protein